MSFDPHGYISFETALSAHGVMDHLIHCLQIATAGSDRILTIEGVGRAPWIALPDDFLFGDIPGSRLDFPDWRVAEPEKALCDLMWLCESRGFALPVESLRLDEIEIGRFERYAARMDLDTSWLRGAKGRFDFT